MFIVLTRTGPQTMETVTCNPHYHLAVAIGEALFRQNLSDYTEIREHTGEGGPPTIVWCSTEYLDPFAENVENTALLAPDWPRIRAAVEQCIATAPVCPTCGLLLTTDSTDSEPPAYCSEYCYDEDVRARNERGAEQALSPQYWQLCAQCHRLMASATPQAKHVDCCCSPSSQAVYCSEDCADAGLMATPPPSIERTADLSPDYPLLEARLAVRVRLDPRVPRGQTAYTAEQLDKLAVAVQQMFVQYLTSVHDAPLPGGVVSGWSCGAVSLMAVPIEEP
jgi:hypothetical protein